MPRATARDRHRTRPATLNEVVIDRGVGDLRRGHHLVVIALIAAAAVTLTSCEYIPFSGGPLEGPVVASPANWAQVGADDIIEIETNPAEPYSVKLWIVAMHDALYIHAGDNYTTWVEHLLEVDERLRLKAHDEIYEMVARRNTDAAIYADFMDGYDEKYGVRPQNENVDEVYFFELTGRL